MADHDFLKGGWNWDKYRVEKSDGTPIEPGAVYAVLRIDSDPHARTALRHYAMTVSGINPILAADIMVKLDETEDVFGNKHAPTYRARVATIMAARPDAHPRDESGG
jgi:hypothetical protein